MSYNIIPLTTNPDQSLTCTIPVDSQNITLDIRCRYNTEGSFWYISISDSLTGKMLLDSVPLVLGVDILEQYPHLEIGSCAVLKIGNTHLDMPDSTSLGTDFVLLWGDRVG